MTAMLNRDANRISRTHGRHTHEYATVMLPPLNYVGKHRRVNLTKPVNMVKRAPVAQRVDLRKRYVNVLTGKVNLRKVVLSKGVK